MRTRGRGAKTSQFFAYVLGEWPLSIWLQTHTIFILISFRCDEYLISSSYAFFLCIFDIFKLVMLVKRISIAFWQILVAPTFLSFNVLYFLHNFMILQSVFIFFRCFCLFIYIFSFISILQSVFIFFVVLPFHLYLLYIRLFLLFYCFYICILNIIYILNKRFYLFLT